MALAIDIMRGGQSAGSARAFNGAVAPSVSAAGTTISDATNLQATTNYLTTVASGAGVQLPGMEIGDNCVVYNSGANECIVYPESSSVAINQIAAGSGAILPIETAMLFWKVSSTQVVAFMSA